MGVRGLTTYILQNKQFLKDSELPHNSSLVLDGDSVAANIFIQCLDKTTCFGGNYEIYENGIVKFFTMLLDCKISPYVLLDGAVPERKFKTVLQRMKLHTTKSLKLNCTNEEKYSIYPVLLWSVFKDVLQKMNIPMVICDYECDEEVANIAKQLNCPVLSNDSDFFIFDVVFIPFYLNLRRNWCNLFVHRKLETDADTGIKSLNMYLRCKIFDREKFLSSTKLTMTILPVLAVYLGNDYFDRNHVHDFYSHIKIEGRYICGNFVDVIITWLAEKTSAEAIDVMLSYIETKKNNALKDLVLETIDSYKCKESKYIKCLKLSSTQEKLEDSSVTLSTGSRTFLEKYRKGFFHHDFLNIVLFHRYFPKPLVEKIELNHCHTSSFQIISAMHEILTNASGENLRFYGRVQDKLIEQIVPKFNQHLPTYEQLQNITLENRMKLFLDILNIKEEFIANCLKTFPTSWQILLITLKYISQVSSLESNLIKSLFLSKIVISYIDQRIGLVRTWKNFEKYKNYTLPQRKSTYVVQSLLTAFEEIDLIDSVAAIGELIPYFEPSELMKTDPNFFDRNLLHSMSEFESCFLHIDMLNDLFNRPFEKCSISEFFNGTFIYIVYFELRHKNAYFIDAILEKSPNILNCFQCSINLIKNQIRAI